MIQKILQSLSKKQQIIQLKFNIGADVYELEYYKRKVKKLKVVGYYSDNNNSSVICDDINIISNYKNPNLLHHTQEDCYNENFHNDTKKEIIKSCDGVFECFHYKPSDKLYTIINLKIYNLEVINCVMTNDKIMYLCLVDKRLLFNFNECDLYSNIEEALYIQANEIYEKVNYYV